MAAGSLGSAANLSLSWTRLDLSPLPVGQPKVSGIVSQQQVPNQDAASPAAEQDAPLGLEPAAAYESLEAPSAGAVEQLARTRRIIEADPAGASTRPPEAQSSLWHGFWTRAVFSNSTEENNAPVLAQPAAAASQLPAQRAVDAAPLKTTPPAPRGWRVPAMPIGLGGLYALLRLGLPSWLPDLWSQMEKYVAGGGILLAVYAGNRLIHRAIDGLAERGHWRPNTVMAVSLATSALVWGLGGALALHAFGVSTATLLKTFGLGGVGMTMAAKDFIGGFLEAVKLLINRPFVINDRVRITAEEYVVRDMDLYYVYLLRADGAIKMMTYAQLAGQAVTVFREYSQRSPDGSPRAHIGERMRRLLGEIPRLSLAASSLWTILGLGLSASLFFFPALAPAAIALHSWVRWAQAATVLVAAHFLQRGLVGFIGRLSQRPGWSPQAAVVVKLIAQLLVYLLGGSIALFFLGMSWPALLASLGATSLVMGWAAADFLGNLIQGLWILFRHPFTLGDTIEIGGVSGIVADMNINYVVLSHSNKSHTVIPYAVIRNSPIIKIPPSTGSKLAGGGR